MTRSATTTIHSTKAGSYLQQLCKHFGHKVEADFTPNSGWIKFGFGRADLSAEPDCLKMTATSDDPQALATLKQVLASHLERFAFREDLRIDWKE
ncbi:hypothetical protein shim_24740 [Shimia sp. SK013]|uniref:DUF2218 domain-containing protein n=1 Tax=Shimia sp. SK013 TaxID=1389006 RepID=UPI0006CD9E5F|nr:DUF2218 domain-containing protein [Shimia sp. SK013]KPA21767.1 hypothetical protein shim_24740 [Shimia sp. SK013]